jgi:hypothetical protein
MWQKKCINSNAKNSRRIERNQKLFGEWKEPLFSFHSNVLSMDSAVLSTKLSRIEFGDRIFEIQKNSLNFQQAKAQYYSKIFYWILSIGGKFQVSSDNSLKLLLVFNI